MTVSQATILLYGHDPQLLQTRQWLLERSGVRVHTAEVLSDLIQIAPGEPIDLIILCHSLSMEQCGRALALAHTRWPKIQSLVLISGEDGCYSSFSEQVADTSRGPAYLLQTVATLIGPQHAVNSHAA